MDLLPISWLQSGDEYSSHAGDRYVTGNSLASTNTVQPSIVTKHLLLFSCIL